MCEERSCEGDGIRGMAKESQWGDASREVTICECLRGRGGLYPEGGESPSVRALIERVVWGVCRYCSSSGEASGFH